MANFYEDMGIPNPDKKGKAPMVQEAEPSNAGPPILLHDRQRGVNGEDRFRILHPIGVASSGSHSYTVYTAALIAEKDSIYSGMKIQDVFVAVKCVHMYQEADIFTSLKSEVDKNGLITVDHQGLLKIRKPFIYNDYFCVVFPFMELGSLRAIMANQFPEGWPESCILLAIGETLKGLSVLHELDKVHGDISAARILVNGKPEIKLAFSASVHDPYTDQDQDSPFLPMASVCEWAAAPEVFGTDQSQYTAKADIWLIGMTALELAYGGLMVKSRDQLLEIVANIHKKRRLPKKEKIFQEKPKKEKNVSLGELIKKKKKLNLGKLMKKKELNLGKLIKKRVFSKGFEQMVIRCLNMEAANRPTATELLALPIFQTADFTVFERYNLY